MSIGKAPLNLLLLTEANVNQIKNNSNGLMKSDRANEVSSVNIMNNNNNNINFNANNEKIDFNNQSSPSSSSSLLLLSNNHNNNNNSISNVNNTFFIQKKQHQEACSSSLTQRQIPKSNLSIKVNNLAIDPEDKEIEYIYNESLACCLNAHNQTLNNLSSEISYDNPYSISTTAQSVFTNFNSSHNNMSL